MRNKLTKLTLAALATLSFCFGANVSAKAEKPKSTAIETKVVTQVQIPGLNPINRLTTIGATEFIVTADQSGVLVYTVHGHLIHHNLKSGERKKIGEPPCLNECVATTGDGKILYTRIQGDDGEIIVSQEPKEQKLADLPRFSDVLAKTTAQHRLLVCDKSDMLYVHSSATKTNGESISYLSSVDTKDKGTAKLRTLFESASGVVTSLKCDENGKGLYYSTSIRDRETSPEADAKLESAYLVTHGSTDLPLLLYQNSASSEQPLIQGIGTSTAGPWLAMRSPSWIETPFQSLLPITDPPTAEPFTIDGRFEIKILAATAENLVISRKAPGMNQGLLFTVSRNGIILPLNQVDSAYVEGSAQIDQSSDAGRLLFMERDVSGQRMAWANLNGSQRRSRAVKTDSTAILAHDGKCRVVAERGAHSNGGATIWSQSWNGDAETTLVNSESGAIFVGGMQKALDSNSVVVSADVTSLHRHLLYEVKVPTCVP